MFANTKSNDITVFANIISRIGRYKAIAEEIAPEKGILKPFAEYLRRGCLGYYINDFIDVSWLIDYD